MFRKRKAHDEQPKTSADRRRQLGRRSFVLFVLSVLATLTIVSALVKPAPAHAQFGGVVSDIGATVQRVVRNVIDAARWISTNVDKVIDKVAKKVGDVAFKNALKVFLGKIAEDTATWVASAGTGQKPLFITDPNYFKDLGNAAAGDYLDTLSKEKFGVSLCDPGAFKVTLDISLRVNLNPNFCKQACQQNYAAGLNEQKVDVITATFMGSTPTLEILGLPLSDVRKAVAYLQNPPKGDIGDQWACKNNSLTTEACLKLYTEALNRGEAKIGAELKQCNSMCAAKKARLASCTLNQIDANARQGLLSSGLTINGQATNITGASLQEAFNSGDLPKIFRPDQNPLGMFLTASSETASADLISIQKQKDILTFNGISPIVSLISGKVKTPGALNTASANKKLNPDDPTITQTGSPMADAFGIFTNTLTNKLIDRIFKKGIVDDKGNPKNFTSFGGSGTISQSKGGVQAARERFSTLAQVTLGAGGGVDILNELSGCAVDVTKVSETSLGVVQPNNCVLDPAFRQAVEERLTVREAIKRGLLSEGKTFGFDANGKEPDFRNGYPYRSLVILRKYRIIPVGWELAAQHIRDFEKQNVTLSTVVNQFDDSTSPYYRLADPSWVLKAPENICKRTGYGEVVVSDTFVDTDGDEGTKKNLDYDKRYCNTDSDANVGQLCDCVDGAGTTPDDKVTPCVSSYKEGSLKVDMKGKCTEGDTSGKTNKATCAFITPRQRQVQRLESCVEDQSCILEKDDGTCAQYGTCTEERDAWRFNGQSCNEQYASCATFTEPAGTEVSYLQNTLQKSVCGPDNAGCQQYCTAYDYGAGAWACKTRPWSEATTAMAGTKRFDRDLQSCDPANEGCTQFIRQTTGTNLIANGGFEMGTVLSGAGNMKFDGWGIDPNGLHCGAQGFALTPGFSGSQALRLQQLVHCGGGDSGQYAGQGIETGTPLHGRTFTFSMYARSEGATCSAEVDTRSKHDFSPGARYMDVTPEWQRFTLTHTWDIPEANRSMETALIFFLRTHPSCILDYDNVQIEEGELTDYKEYGSVNLVHLKRPPSGYCSNNLNSICEADADCVPTLADPTPTCKKLQCTGDPATDPAACSKFIAKCTADDVGCDLFTPVAGGMVVPAKPGISCPADKVGCASFREQSTIGALDPDKTRTGMYCYSDLLPQVPPLLPKFTSCSTDADCTGGAGDCRTLVSFIGKSGKQCTAQDVGCEAFTNLDEVAKGGEGKAQFTKLQLCVPLSHDPLLLSDYYSWVGSNETGYQLKKFLLVHSNLDAAPCTNLAHASLACIDGTPGHDIASCTLADIGVNLDCNQYYDSSGNITYRLRSRVIEQTDNCHPYRNAVDNNIYYADSGRSLTCSIEAVGCREYVGNTGSNTHTVLSSDFENGSFSPWVLFGGSGLSTESISFGGHSLLLDTGGTPTAYVPTPDLIQPGKTYVVKFWARSKDPSPNDLTVSLQRIDPPIMYMDAFGTVALTTDWNEYTLGPVTYASDSANKSTLFFFGGDSLFLDNVTLTELTDSTYKIKASQTACGGFEGCAEYRNRSGQVVDLMSFAKLCQTNKVGCEALINTQNSSTPFKQNIILPNLRGDVDGSGKIDQADVDALNAYIRIGGPPPFPKAAGDIDADADVDADDLTALTNYIRGTGGIISNNPYNGDEIYTPGDAVEFWVNDPAKACTAADKGCRLLGREQINLDGTTYQPVLKSTDTVYAKDNPDAYATTLCGLQALSCEEYTTADGGKAYFRNPSGRTCEYREVGGAAGWYLKGSNDKCPLRNQGNIPPAVPTGGFAGLCPAEQNGCNSFLDPLGTGESLTTNSNFEVEKEAPAIGPKSWDAGVGASLQEYAAHSGSQAVRLSLDGAGYFNQTVSLSSNTYYVISTEVERGHWCDNEHDRVCTTDGDCNGTGKCVPGDNPIRLGVVGCRDALGAQVRLYSPDNSMFSDNSGAYQEVPADRFSKDSWTRLSGRVYSGTAVTCDVFAGTKDAGAGHWFDNLQIRSTTNTPVLKQSVDSTSCNGQVGDSLGCHLFNDTSNSSLAYDVDQSPVGAKPTDAAAIGDTAPCTANPESCDSNTVLKVSPDRTCSKWLAPTTTIESTKPSGQKENLVLGFATCDQFSPSGQCSRWVDEKRCAKKPKQTCIVDDDCGVDLLTGLPTDRCVPFPLNGNTQAYSREDLRNRSGLVVAGLELSNTCSNDRSKSCSTDADCGGAPNKCILNNLIKGKFPFGIAPQIGDSGLTVKDDLLNGQFNTGATLQTSGWVLAANGMPKTGDAGTNADGSKARLVKFDSLKTGAAPVEVDPYVEVEPTDDIEDVFATTLRTTNATLSSKLSHSTYMLSFSLKYLEEPTAVNKDSYFRAGISSRDLTNSVDAWYGQAVPTTTWQRFVVGPLNLNKGAKPEEGNIDPSHKDLDALSAFVFIEEQATNRTPFAIDNVSLLPTLQVDNPAKPQPSIIGQPSGQVNIARDCRAYPASSSTLCSYSDDTGKQFNGWQGYCLEKDPQNPNSCLSWYPVDLLAGSSNIFGKIDAAGYSGKSPLFMCTRASGNYNRPVNLDYQGPGREAIKTFDSGIVSIGNSPLLDEPFAYRRPAVTQVHDYVGGFCNSVPGICGKTGETPDGCLVRSGTKSPCPYMKFDADPQDKILMNQIEQVAIIRQAASGDWIPDNTNNYVNDHACNKFARSYTGTTPDGSVYMILNRNSENAPGYDGTINCAANQWCGEWKFHPSTLPDSCQDDATNFLRVKINFVDSGFGLQVNSFEVQSADGYLGGEFRATIMFYLREQCTQVVQVVQPNGTNVAWSSNSTSPNFILPNYLFKMSQDATPFGSIAPPTGNTVDPNEPTTWDGQAEDGKQPLQVMQNTAASRAGSAYACGIKYCTIATGAGNYVGKLCTTNIDCGSPGKCQQNGNCSGRQCFGISTDKFIDPVTKLAKPLEEVNFRCDTADDIWRCESNGGYCNGFGTVKVCVTGPKADPGKPFVCNIDSDCSKDGEAGTCGYGGFYCSKVSGLIAKVGLKCNGETDVTTCGVADPTTTPPTPAGKCSGFINTSGGAFASKFPTPPPSVYPYVPADPTSRLRLLFANVYGGWMWDAATSAYIADLSASDPLFCSVVGAGHTIGEACTTDASCGAGGQCGWWQKAYINMVRCGFNGTNRLEYTANPNKAYCGIPPEVANITIGQTTSGNVFIKSGEMLNLKFNSIVDNQQLPLKQIAIDWGGDGNSDQVIDWGFANKANPTDPHSIGHVYRYGADSSHCYKAGTGLYGTNPTVGSHDYCIAHPQVQLKDNWEWCNYRSNAPGASDGRCFGFPVNDKDYWQPFDGDVVIIRN